MSEVPREVDFHPASLEDLKAWPDEARQRTGYQIHRLQEGEQPNSWGELKTVGKGVREIRISSDGGWWRVVYVLLVKDVVHILHCFQKKSNRTLKSDLETAKERYKDVVSREASKQRKRKKP